MSPNRPGRLLASLADRTQLLALPFGALSGRPSFSLDDITALGSGITGRSGPAAPHPQAAGTPSPVANTTRPILLTGAGFFSGSPSVSSMLPAASPIASPASTLAPRHRTPSSASSVGVPIAVCGGREVSDLKSGSGGGGGGGGGDGGGGAVTAVGGGGGGDRGVGEEGESASRWQSQLREDARHAAALVEAASRHRSTVSQPLGCDLSGGDQEVAAASTQAAAAPLESLGCVRRKGAVLTLCVVLY
jgi:hypothetical protein